MNNIEKMNELKQNILENNRFPVVYREERHNQDKACKFSDGTDMAIFLQRMVSKYKNNKLSDEEVKLYQEIMEIKESLKNQRYNKIKDKLIEVKQISIEQGYRPISKYSNSDNNQFFHCFSDETDMGSFIAKCKKNIKNDMYPEKIKMVFEDLMTNTDSYQTYIFKKKIEELKETMEEKGFIPVFPQKFSNKNRIIAFSDGTDMGHFIARNQKLYNSDEMSEELIIIWKDFLTFVERFKKKQFLKKIMIMYNKILETNDTINLANSIDDDSYKFSDGSNMYFFITTTKERIKKQRASNFEKWLFNKFLKFQEDFKNHLKAKEAMRQIIELERYPIIDYNNRDTNLIRKFSDNTDIGRWLRKLFKRAKYNQLTEGEKPIAQELMTLNFDKIKQWNYNYIKLKEYYQNSQRFCEDDSNIKMFMKENINVYTSINKSLQDEIHMEMLDKLNSNWVNDFSNNTDTKVKNLVKH